MIKFSIIINTHNQNQYIYKAIKSCLNQHYKSFEILIINSSKYRIDLNKFSAMENKKIKYYHIKSRYTQPELNQMNKILVGLKKSKGSYLVFLDGDDTFANNKLSNINKILENKDIICNQDLPIMIENNFKRELKRKSYKNNFLTKYIFSQWPQIYGTSSIFIKSNALKVFFDKAKPFKWKLIAIDAQVIIFCNEFFNQYNYLSGVTRKRIHTNNIGTDYMNLFKKKFWLRRNMQFEYTKFIKKNNSLSLDYIVTKIIYVFLRNL